jgi:ABC-type multidrug transport system permease subunit
MSWSFAGQTAVKELRRWARDPMALLMMLGIPLLLGGLFCLAFGRGGSDVRPKAKLLLVDQDDTFLSGFLARAFGPGSDAPIAVETVRMEEGRTRLDAGEASALLVVPKGFSQAVLEETPATLELVTNPAQRILPGIVEGLVRALLDAAFYVQRLAGPTLRRLAEAASEDSGRINEAALIASALEIRGLVKRLDRYLDPLLLDVEVQIEAASNGPRPSYAALMAPGILFMALVFLAQALSQDLWREHEQKTLRRVRTTPQAVSWFLLGKLAADVLIVALVCVTAFGLGAWAFGLKLSRLPAALGWSVYCGCVFLLLLGALQLHASSRRGADLLASLVMFPLLILGGSFFPFEAMPDVLAAAGRWTPNGRALAELRAILGGAAEPGSLLASGAALGLFGAACLGLCLRRMRRAFLEG